MNFIGCGMKGHLERVPQRIGLSWRYKKIVEPCKSYGWHRHEEYEIAIHRHFSGQCFVDHHNSEVYHNHMIMLAPNIPHAVYSSDESGNDRFETHVIWFKKEWVDNLIANCHEFMPLKHLLAASQKGIVFSPDTAEQATLILTELESKKPINQLIALIKVFEVLLADKNIQLLLPTPENEADQDDKFTDKLRKTESYLLANYHHPITLKPLADHLYTSESSVRRLFQKHYNESFSQHLKKIRLNVACGLLMNTDLPIRIVMEKVGYENQANFNRQFKQYKQVTPLEYRKKVKPWSRGV
ncbi:putative transcriptional regulator, AraC family protein [Vibrio nigripulchritudo SOn1]|uniref:Transcriptional regulator, AraC family protein n=2 Tax=Vibrio nigripulchritudo TaxID=28173 RepID=A0AAV2VP09_9VIBR|nr:putative transcriptional regulator, AraC family protein [Vibrio nigripulchritudo SOn1]